MHLHVKIPRNAGKNIFRESQGTNMLPMTLVGVKVLTER